MPQILLTDLGFKVAWKFSELLPGEFERDRKEVAGIKFPVVGPLPTHGKQTPPFEGRELLGPYLYILVDARGQTKYVGVATESGLSSPIERWIRPDKAGTSEYWAHGTNKRKGKATVVWLKEGLLAGDGPYSLYFSNYAHLAADIKISTESRGGSYSPLQQLSAKKFIEDLEHALIFALQPEWNIQKRKTAPPPAMEAAAKHWYAQERI